MVQTVTTEDDLSPCNGVCVLEDGVCIGCNRLEDEIIRWPDMGKDEKLMILEYLGLEI